MVLVTSTESQGTSVLMQVSNALVALHKDQFGRGPNKARSNFAGPDALLCVLSNALLPAERKMVRLGEAQGVRDSRTAFQAATADEFIRAIETITVRKVVAFASGIDPATDTVFECFSFEPLGREDSAPSP